MWFFWLAAVFGLLGWLAPLLQARLSGWWPAHLRDTPLDTLAVWPRLSVIVPALNEEATIGPAMESLLALDYPALQIIAVDDRSSDRTGAILDALAARDPRLRVVHVRALPTGWLGKNHAMHLGAAQAGGDLLLFTDADVHFEPTCLRRAVAIAKQRRLDHLILFPEVELHGFWETASVWFFGLLLSLGSRVWDVPNPRRRAFMGIGAFNLVRADAYRRAGGHAALPMEVADDMKLGKLLKRAGGRADCALSDGMVRVRWVVGLRGIVVGLTKNLFAGFEFRPAAALGACVVLMLVAVWPLVGLLVGPAGARLTCAATLCIMVYAAWRTPPAPRLSPLYGLAFPLAALVVIYIILRSMAFTYRQGGIVWRGTKYPLDELRKGVV